MHTPLLSLQHTAADTWIAVKSETVTSLQYSAALLLVNDFKPSATILYTLQQRGPENHHQQFLTISDKIASILC